MIQVTPTIQLDESEIHLDFVRASGPGGQNVNKVATSVQLRFNARQSPSLPEEVRQRLLRLASGQITERGELLITARQFRTQERNRQDAIDRLIALIQRAAERPVPRHKTRPTLASQQRRLEGKRRQGATKRLRRSRPSFED